MSLTLSSADLATLNRAIQLLVSPLDFAHVDQWRSAVNRQLKELLCADSAGFLLPVSEGLLMFSEEHDPEELAAYPDLVPPDVDGMPLWERTIRSGVDTAANLYGRDYHQYLGSAYYNEYAAPSGAHDTLAASISLGGLDVRSMASLQFWHARPEGRLFAERELALLRLLFPAFRAGVEAQVRWGSQRVELLHTLDGLGQAALVCDSAGGIVHATPALVAATAEESEASLLREEMLAVARELCRSASGRDGHSRAPGGLVREVHTQGGRYRITGCIYGGSAAGASAVAVVCLERQSPVALSEAELCATFSLTRAQARVAALLGQGKSNEEVAKELFISPHTARRHTERVLQKLNVRSRAEVASKVYA
jgi:DNA-binding CsgD family transcriptional regulator